MKFKITRSKLLTVLNDVSHGLSFKTPMPVLTGIKIDAYLSSLTFTTSNREISVRVQQEQNEDFEIFEEGSCVVPGKYFIDIAKKIDDDVVNFVLFEENTIKITTEKTDFTLNALNKDAFPAISFEAMGSPIVLKSKVLKQAIRQTNFAAGTSEARVILTGTCFEIQDSTLTMTATDSYRLARKTILLDQEYQHIKINIPSKSLDELEKILSDTENEVQIYLISNKALILIGEVSFVTRLIEGNFPNTSSLFPTDHLVILDVKKSDLISSVDRVSLFTNMDSTNIIKVQIKSNKTVQLISTSTEIGKVVEDIVPLNQPDIDSFQTAFSAKYLLEALKAFDSSVLSISFTGEVKPFVINSASEPDITQLILPVRIF